MSDPDAAKSFWTKLKDSMTPWVFKKADQETTTAAATATATAGTAAVAVSAPTGAQPSEQTAPEAANATSKNKKAGAAGGKREKVKRRVWNCKCLKKKE
ncbi:hypothetical protein DV738_g1460, partial [Chaetothyriales sp. CBS 135597]